MNLTITQTSASTENVRGANANNLSRDLYNLAKNPLNTISLSGEISVPIASLTEATYLNSIYGPDFNISANVYSVSISDPVLELILIERYGGDKGYLAESDFNNSNVPNGGSNILVDLTSDARWNNIEEIDLRFIPYVINTFFDLPTSCRRVLLNKGSAVELWKWSKSFVPYLEYVYIGEAGCYGNSDLFMGTRKSGVQGYSTDVTWVIGGIYSLLGQQYSLNTTDKFTGGNWNFPWMILITNLYINADRLVTQREPTYGSDQKDSIDNNVNNAWTNGGYAGKITNLYIPQNVYSEYSTYWGPVSTNVTSYDFTTDPNNILPEHYLQ